MERGTKFESLTIAFFLAMIGGFGDTYSYLNLGEVFSGLQTGNLVLFSINLAHGNINGIEHYIVPILFFVIGSGMARWIEYRHEKLKSLVWQEVILMIEFTGFIVLWLIAKRLPVTLVASWLSFVMAFHVHSFRSLHGHPYGTTMNTGNLKSIGNATMGLLLGRECEKNRILLTDTLGVVSGFALGAILTAIISGLIGINAAFLGLVMIIIVIILTRIW